MLHHRCIRTMLGITNRQQWEQRLTSVSTREQWGDVVTITVKLMNQLLEWLGYLARMSSCRLLKMSLFSRLPQTCPHGGPRRKWQDLMKRDMKAAGISEARWYDNALHRDQWYVAYNQKLSNYQQIQQQQTIRLLRDVGCDECGRVFRRECNKSRHRCAAERQWPVCEQRGAIQCSVCDCWFRSIGGLTVHHCGKQLDTSSTDDSTTTI